MGWYLTFYGQGTKNFLMFNDDITKKILSLLGTGGVRQDQERALFSWFLEEIKNFQIEIDTWAKKNELLLQHNQANPLLSAAKNELDLMLQLNAGTDGLNLLLEELQYILKEQCLGVISLGKD